MVFHNPAEKPDVAIDDRAVFIARIYGLAGDTLMLNRQLVPVDVPPVDVHLKRVYHYPALCEERMLAIVDSLGIKDSFVGNGQSSHSRQFNYDEILKVRAAINRAFTLVCTSPDVPTNCYPYVVPKKNGVVPVMGRVTINGTQSQFSCKKNIPLTLWDAKGNCAKGRSKEAL